MKGLMYLVCEDQIWLLNNAIFFGKQAVLSKIILYASFYLSTRYNTWIYVK